MFRTFLHAKTLSKLLTKLENITQPTQQLNETKEKGPEVPNQKPGANCLRHRYSALAVCNYPQAGTDITLSSSNNLHS